MSANKPTANSAVKDTKPYALQTKDVSNNNSRNAIHSMMQLEMSSIWLLPTQSSCCWDNDRVKHGKIGFAYTQLILQFDLHGRFQDTQSRSI